MDSVVSGACILAGGMLNCNLSNRRSVAVLCMLYKVRCNPKHPLCGALPVPYVPVRVTRFLAGGVLNFNLSNRRSLAVLCLLYKIRCNPKHPLCGALPVPYVPVRVTRGALIAHRYTYAPPRCRTSQFRRTFIPLSVSLWNDLVDPVFDGVGLAGFKSRSNAFLLA